MMRGFTSIELPKDIKNRLYDLQKRLRGNEAKVNWIDKSKLHLTLKFLGKIDETKLEKVKERLEKIRFKSFKIELGKIGTFSSRNQIRVIFIGLNPIDEILNLQKEIDSNLLDIFSSDERFHGHITLGRVKLVKNKKILLEKLNQKITGGFKVDKFHLVKSVLSKDGPKYTNLESYDLN